MSDLVVGILRRVAADVLVFEDCRSVPEDTLDSFILSLEIAYRELVIMDTVSVLTPLQKEACDIVRSCLADLRSLQEGRCMSQPSMQPITRGAVGRPSFDIPCEQLTYLIEHRFSVRQVADMLGVSISTVRRRMAEYGISIRAQYSTICDQELDQVIGAIQHEFPKCGN